MSRREPAQRLIVVASSLCPDCHAPRPHTTRSIDNGDGTRTRWRLCDACGSRWKELLEPVPDAAADGTSMRWNIGRAACDHPGMTVAIDVMSIGTLASRARATVAEVRQAADALGITPYGRLNLVPYFDAGDADRIVARLNGKPHNPPADGPPGGD